MKKIISLFQRNYDGDHLVRDEVVPGAEWVQAGDGKATQKLDGTCCMVRSGVLYKRYDAKHGKTPPPDFESAQDYDPITGHMPGWIPVGGGPEDRWHREAFGPYGAFGPAGTFELCGPKINGNPEHRSEHILLRHGLPIYEDCPTGYAELKQWLEDKDIEGIVWHHPDGRMVKIKKKDFGLRRMPDGMKVGFRGLVVPVNGEE